MVERVSHFACAWVPFFAGALVVLSANRFFLATAQDIPGLAEKAPDGDNWIHEIKFDGYRIQARRDGAKRFLTVGRGIADVARRRSSKGPSSPRSRGSRSRRTRAPSGAGSIG